MTDKFDDDKRVKQPEGEKSSKREQDLDEALYDSFPASDPVSIIQPGEPTSPKREGEINRNPPADKIKRK